jgi:hypothetical protein
MYVNVNIDPEVDNELDVIHRTVMASIGQSHNALADNVRISLIRLRTRKGIADLARLGVAL